MIWLLTLVAWLAMGWLYWLACGTLPGCCYVCSGTGVSGDWETNGMCWDCRATGHPHEPRWYDRLTCGGRGVIR